ncbi:hypothetical protein QBC38DRAFT_491855 [Podospora fimiseda]|uniref:Cytochrome b561 domain-containing protein n=1 Tax=Podospora fimiseda TaxID=252190 RepID=A0AAN6YLN3_9PEZI|nr:hypothetical protein QBC38DRAFT_491855 [Podospora fimiseda]
MKKNLIINMETKQLLALLLAANVRAQQYGGYGNPYVSGSGSGSSGSSSSGSSSSGSSSSDSSSSSGNFNGNFQAGASFDVNEAMRVRAIHGILAAVAMAVLFPGGSILMRIIPGRFAIWAHGLAQIAALSIFIAGVALGLQLVRIVRIPNGNGDMWSDPSVNYHPIIGIVVFVCLLIQPILGFIHHAKFKELQRRQIWSYLHLFNGRIFITLGIANGGLGLWMAGASKKTKTAYVAVAAVMWALWMLSAVWGEWRRWKVNRIGYPRNRNKFVYDGDVAF